MLAPEAFARVTVPDCGHWLMQRSTFENVAVYVPLFRVISSVRFSVVHVQSAGRRAHVLIQARAALELPSGWELHEVGLEELVLAYLREPYALLSKPQGLSDPDRMEATR